MARLGRDLGAAELEILSLLWDTGPLTVRDVLTKLHERDRKLAYTTVQTYLTRLEQKNFVASDREGIAYVYRPKVSREKVTRSKLRQVLDQCFEGSPGALALRLMQTESFTPDEIRQLQEMVEKLDRRAQAEA